MQTTKFQQQIGGTTEFMKRLMVATKGCSQLTSNDTYFADSWFSVLMMAEELMVEKVDYCGEAKTSHKGFCLATLENLMKDWPGRSYLVLKSTPIVPGGIPLLAIGYKYNSRKFLVFIATEGAGSNEPGYPYLSRFPDIFIIFLLAPLFILTC